MSQIWVQLSSWFRIRNSIPFKKQDNGQKEKTSNNCFETLDRCLKKNLEGIFPVTAACVADKIKKREKTFH